MERVSICSVPLDPITMAEAVSRINALIDRKTTETAHVVTVNAQFIELARKDMRFANLLKTADLSVADGVPLVWASRLLGQRLPERVNGTDLMGGLCEAAALNGNSVYLLGGRPGAADAAARQLIKKYPALKVAGTNCPPYGFENNRQQVAEIARRIEKCQPDLLFVGLGAPKQEFWISKNSHLPAKVMIGVGGSFELIAGMVMRAPVLIQTVGCEWLWRLCLDPTRLWKRYLVGNPLFIVRVLTQWFEQLTEGPMLVGGEVLPDDNETFTAE